MSVLLCNKNGNLAIPIFGRGLTRLEIATSSSKACHSYASVIIALLQKLRRSLFFWWKTVLKYLQLANPPRCATSSTDKSFVQSDFIANWSRFWIIASWGDAPNAFLYNRLKYFLLTEQWATALGALIVGLNTSHRSKYRGRPRWTLSVHPGRYIQKFYQLQVLCS